MRKMHYASKKYGISSYWAYGMGHYVYVILREGKIAYVGKGQGNRVFHSYKKHSGTGLVIVCRNMSYSESLELEESLIKMYEPEDNVQHSNYCSGMRVGIQRVHLPIEQHPGFYVQSD